MEWHWNVIFLFIDDFDDERQDIIERLSYCSVDQTEVHKLEWENKKRTEEIWSLQKVIITFCYF